MMMAAGRETGISIVHALLRFVRSVGIAPHIHIDPSMSNRHLEVRHLLAVSVDSYYFPPLVAYELIERPRITC